MLNPIRTYFGARARLYDIYRPNPPTQIINLLGNIKGIDALDLGAGTGKWSSFLYSHGAVVSAAEPDQAMCSFFTSKLPWISIYEAQAESLPFVDSCFDLIVAGDSWHWFNSHEAIDEIARILRNKGIFFVAHNRMDRSVGWLMDLVRPFIGERSVKRASRSAYADLLAHANFELVKNFSLPYTWNRSADELSKYLATRLRYCALGKSDFNHKVDSMAIQLRSQIGTGKVAIPMIVQGTIARRREISDVV